MLVPIEWLKEFVDINVSTTKLSEMLTMTGSKVESITRSDPNDSDSEIIEFEITSNRPDCLSILGIAREVAATLKTNLHVPDFPKIKNALEPNSFAKVSILDLERCPKYCACIITDIKIEPSPAWMQKRLTSVGIRPINNIVDITNYVMIELGQPMHAFDFDTLLDDQVVVRTALEDEKLETLDNKIRYLSKNDLVIANSRNAIGIAGVMGGAHSEISTNTKRILLESANFNRTSIRLTSKKLGLRTDASHRFEKGVDLALSKKAIERCVYLIENLKAGKIDSGLIEEGNDLPLLREIPIDYKRINTLIGLCLEKNQIDDILELVHINISKQNAVSYAVLPSYRSDIEDNADLAEEVARIYGYDKIPLSAMGASSIRGSKTRSQKLIDLIKEILVGVNFFETTTLSFTTPKVYSTIGFAESEFPLSIELQNPLGEDQSVLRTTLAPNMMEVLSKNYIRGQSSVRIFEISKVFLPYTLPLEDLPNEKTMLSLAFYGNKSDFFTLKSIVDVIFRELGIEKEVSYVKTTHPTYHPGRTAKIILNGNKIGVMGEIHPKVAQNFEMSEMRVLLAELDLDQILESANTNKKFSSIPKFPEVKRDLAFVANKDIPAETVGSLIRKLAGGLLFDLELFDVYEGSQVPEGLRSLAYSLSYRSSERTLRDDEVNAVHQEVIRGLEIELGAKLRK